jgi:hypothetical protein
MPYKFDTQKRKIKREDDNRIKLTDEERRDIKKLYGKISQRKLAKMFKVSRRLIIFIGCPEKLKIQKEQYKERMKDGRYYKKFYNEKKGEVVQTHTYSYLEERKYYQREFNEVMSLDYPEVLK